MHFLATPILFNLIIMFTVDIIKISTLLMNKLSLMSKATKHVCSRDGIFNTTFHHRKHLPSPVTLQVDSFSISTYMGSQVISRMSPLMASRICLQLLLISVLQCSQVGKLLMREITPQPLITCYWGIDLKQGYSVLSQRFVMFFYLTLFSYSLLSLVFMGMGRKKCHFKNSTCCVLFKMSSLFQRKPILLGQTCKLLVLCHSFIHSFIPYIYIVCVLWVRSSVGYGMNANKLNIHEDLSEFCIWERTKRQIKTCNKIIKLL